MSKRPLPRTTPAITALWHQYQATPTKKLRDHLVEFFVPFAEYTAHRIHDRLPGTQLWDDVRSAAMVGLLNAFDSFDVTRGLKFETFAIRRIRGAIFDDLRAMDWAPRLVRSRTATLFKSTATLRNALHREPTRDEVREATGASASEFERIEADAIERQTVSTHEALDDGGGILADVIPQSREEDPAEIASTRDAVATLLEAVPMHERGIMIQLYFRHRQQTDVAQDFEISPSRVSQWKDEALRIMRRSGTFTELRDALVA